MPARLVYQPVVLTEGGARMPLSGTLIDTGRAPVASEDDDGNPIMVWGSYVHVSAISNGTPDEPVQVRNNCLSLVAGLDMSNLDAEAAIVSLFESGVDQPLRDLRDWLGSTPTGLGWPVARQVRLRDRITAAGGDVASLTSTTPLWRVVNIAGQIFSPAWDVRVAFTSLSGA